MTQKELICQEIERLKNIAENDNASEYLRGQARICRIILSFIDSLPEETCKDSLQVHETCKENMDSLTDDLDENNRKTRDAEVILNGHGLLVDVTKWADGYKLKVIVKEE